MEANCVFIGAGITLGLGKFVFIDEVHIWRGVSLLEK